FFDVQVFLAGLQTCLFSHTTRAPPAILLSVLDFEPLLFEIAPANFVKQRPRRTEGESRSKEQEKDEEYEERDEGDDGEDSIGARNARSAGVYQHGSYGALHSNHRSNISTKKNDHRVTRQAASYNNTWDAEAWDAKDQCCPSSFDVNKGKSCIFTADPVDLARALQRTSALTLFVVSKLSQRQVAIHGSGVVDISTFGPNLELSRCLPRAVSSWGHLTAKVGSKDPKGRMVATIDLAVSLSCLGATGYLIQPHP
ncbi:unnamed protein product, partial [Hapterophycus canaliculatus]